MPDIFSTKTETGVRTKSEVGHHTLANLIAEKKNNSESISGSVIRYPQSEDEKRMLPGHSNNPLAAFNYFPSKVDFINKDPDEKIILILRRHPITNLKWIIATFCMLVFPSFASILPVFDGLQPKYSLLLLMFWYLATFAYFLESFLNWFFSVNIVTDERIFDVDFYNMIYRKITDANIDQIQDVTVQIGGGLRTMFNYGDVLVQTASEVPEIEFNAIPMPDRVAKVLRELRLEEEIEKLEGRVR